MAESQVSTEERPSRMTEEQLQEFVRGIERGRWYHVKADELETCCSVLIMLGGFSDLSPGEHARIGAIFGDMESTGRSINNLPVFMSVRFVHKEDVPLLNARLQAVYAAKEAALKGV